MVCKTLLYWVFIKCFHRLSFALANQRKNNGAIHKTSMPLRALHQGASDLTMNSHDFISHLPHKIGNQALQRLIRSGTIRPKLKVSLPNDVYEKEADRVAEQIMETPISNSTSTAMYSKDDKISRKCVACEMEEKEEEDDNKKVKLSIGRKSLSNSNNLEATDEITNQINKVRSSEGSSLDNATRDFLEPKLGYDLSDVRIHTGEMGARSAASLNSLAYTIGNDVIFGEGQYGPYPRKEKSCWHMN